MPLYDYRCGACGREVEVMHGIHEAGPGACEACGGPMSKVLSPPAIHFKGSGWAKKDAASGAGKAQPKSSTSEKKTEPAAKGKDGAASGGDGSAGDSGGEKPSTASKSD